MSQELIINSTEPTVNRLDGTHDSLVSSDLDNLSPRFINETLSKLVETEQCDRIELFMRQLSSSHSKYICWDNTCHSIVRLYVKNKRSFTTDSLCFLLRCQDIDLVKQVFQLDLISPEYTDCKEWHIMFIASYQDRFYAHRLHALLDGFLVRFILICKLRCSPGDQKRLFLTWFAGTLHLCFDECFLQYERPLFKYALCKIFESLVLNGLLTYSEIDCLLKMITKRNEDIVESINSRNKMMGLLNHQIDDSNSSSSEAEAVASSGDEYSHEYLNSLRSMFPLSLKNSCRLAIKQSLANFTARNVNALPLPQNLKRFVLFESECQEVYENCSGLTRKRVI